MMAPIPAERLEQVQAALREEMRGSQPEVANLQAVAALVESGTLLYRGKLYSVPPVGFLSGTKLQALLLELVALDGQPATPEALSTRDRICAEAVELFPMLAHRRGPLRWLGWLLPNPFRHATGQEVRTLLHFFYLAGTRSTVGVPSPAQARRN